MTSTLSPIFVTWLQNALTGNKLHGACSAFCHRVAKCVTMDRYLVTRHNLISSAILIVLNFGNVIMIYDLLGLIIS